LADVLIMENSSTHVDGVQQVSFERYLFNIEFVDAVLINEIHRGGNLSNIDISVENGVDFGSLICKKKQAVVAEVMLKWHRRRLCFGRNGELAVSDITKLRASARKSGVYLQY